MIKYEKVRYNVDINYDLLSACYKDESSKKSIKREKQEVLDFITQQEKVNELSKLYEEKSLILVDIMNMKLQTNNKIIRHERYFEVLELIDKLKEELEL